MSKTKAEKLSENEDDPEVYESSGDEWNSSSEQPKKRGRRASQRLSKKPKVTQPDSSEEEEDEPEVEDEEDELDEEDSDEEDYDEDDDDEDDPKSKKNGVNKKHKVTAKITTTTTTTTESDGTKKVTTVKVISAGDFTTGSFVILKKDAQVGDPKKHPCIWRIDGKALLQKYEPFVEDGKVRHKNTSIYAGWSSVSKERYTPIMVYVHQHSDHNMVVEVNWDQLKEIKPDPESDE